MPLDHLDVVDAQLCRAAVEREHAIAGVTDVADGERHARRIVQPRAVEDRLVGSAARAPDAAELEHADWRGSCQRDARGRLAAAADGAGQARRAPARARCPTSARRRTARGARLTGTRPREHAAHDAGSRRGPARSRTAARTVISAVRPGHRPGEQAPQRDAERREIDDGMSALGRSRSVIGPRKLTLRLSRPRQRSARNTAPSVAGSPRWTLRGARRRRRASRRREAAGRGPRPRRRRATCRSPATASNAVRRTTRLPDPSHAVSAAPDRPAAQRAIHALDPRAIWRARVDRAGRADLAHPTSGRRRSQSRLAR